jgi:hypothetical protein
MGIMNRGRFNQVGGRRFVVVIAVLALPTAAIGQPYHFTDLGTGFSGAGPVNARGDIVCISTLLVKKPVTDFSTGLAA